MNVSTKSEAGCLVRTDYIRILQIIRDDPGIMTSEIYRQFIGYRGSSESIRKKILELADAGFIEIEDTKWTREHTITDKGVRALAAIDSVSEEVGL